MTWADHLPYLRRPLLVVALHGFADSGQNARQAANFLRSRWEAERIGQFDADAFIDFRDRRPLVNIEDGRIRQVHLPKIEFWAARLPEAERDVLFLLGPEPDIRWQAFSKTVQMACRRLGVSKLLLLDAYPGMNPHTRSIRLLGVHNQVADDLPDSVAIVSDYQGPISLGHYLVLEVESLNIPAWGVSAELPPYVAGERYPAAILRLVEFVADSLKVAIDTTQLQNNVEAMNAQLDRTIEERPMIAELIERLEEHSDATTDLTDFSLPDGDQLAAEIQRFFADPDSLHRDHPEGGDLAHGNKAGQDGLDSPAGMGVEDVLGDQDGLGGGHDGHRSRETDPDGGAEPPTR